MRWRRVCRWKRINSTLSTTVWRAGYRVAGPFAIEGEVVSDGPLSPAEMTMEVASCCAMLARGGRCSRSRCLMVFPSAATAAGGRTSFESHGRTVGGGPLLDGIAFNVDTALWRITACAKCNWLTSSISTSFAQPQPANYHRQYLANLASSSHKKERGLGTIPLLSPHFD